MKALKTPRARDVLADPQASKQLRQFLTTRHGLGESQAATNPSTIELVARGDARRYKPMIVPKAA